MVLLIFARGEVVSQRWCEVGEVGVKLREEGGAVCNRELKETLIT
jgi:hypothetical protein